MKPSELTPDVAGKILSLYIEKFDYSDGMLEIYNFFPEMFIDNLINYKKTAESPICGKYLFGSRWSDDSQLSVYQSSEGDMNFEFLLNLDPNLHNNGKREAIERAVKEFNQGLEELLNH